MRPKIEELDTTPFLLPEAETEEEKIWVEARVPAETVLSREGLVIFELFDWRKGEVKC